ncbi:MAG: hypothetical protein Q7T82_14615 [Armatimonadota bacterium]|nr:hypothetical protein [Armatimonadota bacterium]
MADDGPSTIAPSATREEDAVALWGEVTEHPKGESARTAVEAVWQKTQAVHTTEAYLEFLERLRGASATLWDKNRKLAAECCGMADQAMDRVWAALSTGDHPQSIDLLSKCVEAYAEVGPLRSGTEEVRTPDGAVTSVRKSKYADLALGRTQRVGKYREEITLLRPKFRWQAISQAMKGMESLGSGGGDDGLKLPYAGDPAPWLRLVFGDPSRSNVGQSEFSLAAPKGDLPVTNARVIGKACQLFLAKHPDSDLAISAKATLERVEGILWKQVESVGGVGACYGYLNAFPDGKFANDAHLRIEEIEDQEWSRACDKDSLAAYAQFAYWYQAGKHAEQLKSAVAKRLVSLAEESSKGSPRREAGESLDFVGTDMIAIVPLSESIVRATKCRVYGEMQQYILPVIEFRRTPSTATDAGFLASLALTTQHSVTSTTTTGLRVKVECEAPQDSGGMTPGSTLRLGSPGLPETSILVWGVSKDYCTKPNTDSRPADREPDILLTAYSDPTDPLVFQCEMPELQSLLAQDGFGNLDSRDFLDATAIRWALGGISFPEKLKYVSGVGVVVIKRKAGTAAFSFGLPQEKAGS